METLILSVMLDPSHLQQALSHLATLVLLMVIAGCIGALSKGADMAIDGVVVLAMRTGLPHIVIGATIVSLGTTIPEAFVSVMAAWMGNPGLALGNGVGSIIADTGLIFGLTCLLTVVPMNRFILNRTGWVQVGAATLLAVIAIGARVTSPDPPVLQRWVGFLFLALLAGYLFMTYHWARLGEGMGLDNEAIHDDQTISQCKCWLMIGGGLLLVLTGSRILIPSVSLVAVRMGVLEDVIAVTMVAFGTSLPELMTAIASVRKGHPEIMVGNVVGADVLNCLFVIGAAAAVEPLQIPINFYHFHFPAMLLILFSFRFFISLMNWQGVFKRWQGGWLLGIYVVYMVLQYSLNIGSTH